MNKLRIKNFVIILLFIVCFFYFIKAIELKNKDNEDNFYLEIKEKLLPLMKEELSSNWHRYYDWVIKLDTNPYIVCSDNDKIVASISHKDYGDIYFIFYKIDDNYYASEIGEKIMDWKNYCS